MKNTEKTINSNQVSKLIKSRRSIFPNSYIDKPIPKHIIETILENANWAPNHRHTEPWRFKVFMGASLQRLSDYLGEWYKGYAKGDAFSEKKYEKTKKKPLQSSCVIAICMQRDPEERVPEWEELAATACAVQNMWLTCMAHDIGAYWSSPAVIKECGDFLRLEEGEKCLGFFYMGYHNLPEIEGKRGAIEDKVKWM